MRRHNCDEEGIEKAKSGGEEWDSDGVAGVSLGFAYSFHFKLAS